MKNYVHIKDETQRRIAMLIDYVDHLNDLGWAHIPEVQTQIAKTKRELAALGYVEGA